MRKDFDRWNMTKKKFNDETEPLYFRDGEIWWVRLGVNVGYEIDGKSEHFAHLVTKEHRTRLPRASKERSISTLL
jgi:hypothetical protein